MIDKETCIRISEKYYNPVYRFCLTHLNEADAQDVTQETFLLFQEKCPYLEDVNIRAWLMAVANRKIKEKHRDNERYLKIAEKVKIFDEAVEFMEEECDLTEEDILKAKEEVISKLSQKEQRLFELIYTQRIKQKDIAKEMGISENAVSVRASRLNKKLKKLVSESYIHLLSILIYIMIFKNF